MRRKETWKLGQWQLSLSLILFNEHQQWIEILVKMGNDQRYKKRVRWTFLHGIYRQSSHSLNKSAEQRILYNVWLLQKYQNVSLLMACADPQCNRNIFMCKKVNIETVLCSIKQPLKRKKDERNSP
uniref:Uncharacterized protein n=1 Tax=Arundo donax TaxID=35708 RepID=A0A0A8XQE5_ARUDO